MNRPEILDRAKQCVCGFREQDYGSPERNFELIADLWNDYLDYDELFKKGEDGEYHRAGYISSTDVAMLMALLKIARIKNGGGTGDSFVDLAGYAACGGELHSLYNTPSEVKTEKVVWAETKKPVSEGEDEGRFE